MKRALVLVDVDNVGRRVPVLRGVGRYAPAAARGGTRDVEVVFGATLSNARGIRPASLADGASMFADPLRRELTAQGGATRWALVLAHQAPESTDTALVTALRHATSPEAAGEIDLLLLVSEDRFVEAPLASLGWVCVRGGVPSVWARGPHGESLVRGFASGASGCLAGTSSPIAVGTGAPSGARPRLEVPGGTSLRDLIALAQARPWAISQLSATNGMARGAARLRAWLDHGTAALDLAHDEPCEIARGPDGAPRLIEASLVEPSAAGCGAVRAWRMAGDADPELHVLRSTLPLAALREAAQRKPLRVGSAAELNDLACVRSIVDGKALASVDVVFDGKIAAVQGLPPSAWWWSGRGATTKQWYQGSRIGVVRAELTRRGDALVLRIARARRFEVEIESSIPTGDIGVATCVDNGERVPILAFEHGLARGHRVPAQRVDRDPRVPPHLRRLPIAVPVSALYVPDVIAS